jgi:hypothetical protein
MRHWIQNVDFVVVVIFAPVGAVTDLVFDVFVLIVFNKFTTEHLLM